MSSSWVWFTGAPASRDPAPSFLSRPHKRQRQHSTGSDVEIVPINEGNVPVVVPTPPIATTPKVIDPPKWTGGLKPMAKSSGDIDLSVFDVLNTFRRRWFLSRANLLANVISTQKAEDRNISWVEFAPQFHSHLVKCTVALVPHRLAMVKKVMFVFILELLNGEGHTSFFELAKGGHKANNAQREKRRLARKRSHAAKRERVREAAKAAQLLARERQCLACGRKFQSRKTAHKHNCKRHSKVVHVTEKMDVDEQVSPTKKPTGSNKPPSTAIAPYVPPAPKHTNHPSGVTGEFRDVKVDGDGEFRWADHGSHDPVIKSDQVRDYMEKRLRSGVWPWTAGRYSTFTVDWDELLRESAGS